MAADPYLLAAIMRAVPSLSSTSRSDGVNSSSASTVTWLDDWYSQVLNYHYAELSVNISSAISAFDRLFLQVDCNAYAVRHLSSSSPLPVPDCSSAALAATLRRIVYRLLPTSQTPQSRVPPRTGAINPYVSLAQGLGTKAVLWVLLDILIPSEAFASAPSELAALFGSFGALQLLTSLTSSLPPCAEVEALWTSHSPPPNPSDASSPLLDPPSSKPSSFSPLSTRSPQSDPSRIPTSSLSVKPQREAARISRAFCPRSRVSPLLKPPSLVLIPMSTWRIRSKMNSFGVLSLHLTCLREQMQ
eukprot:GDKK01063721.1.p1 GENE.GDKK01063721.1~~GDKK01063721.1.p1  ORF type:complete len:302 (+),score=61.23 GDKK01063721.1:228-1133(+)